MSFIAIGCSFLSLFTQLGNRQHQLPPVLETEGDPPALFSQRGFSPRLIVPWGGFTSYQVNVDANQNNIVGDAANEPSICVDPSNPFHIAIGWRQFDSVSSNFRQAGYAYTSDGGLTWTFPGKLENNVFRSDPVLGARYDGTFFYLSLLSSFYDTMWDSTNGGANWSAIAPADGGDKEWFTIDNSNSVGRGNLYQIWSTAGNNYGGRQFTRSTDGGMTWMNPINLPNSPYWGTPDVDNAGTLYIGGWDNSSFRVLRSSNAKNAGGTPTFDLSTAVNLGGSIDYGESINPGGLAGQMWVAVDHSTAAPNPVYVLCSVNVNASNPVDVMIAKSADGGSTWTAPLRINDDPLNITNYHWMASLAVSPSGRVDAVWNDTRDDASHTTSSLYYSYSLDGGKHFSTNIRLTPSFNQSLGYPNQNKMGDYMGVVSNSTGANVAFAATFNHEEDVYYMHIPSPAIVVPTAVTVTGASYTGNTGSLAAVDGNYLVTSVPSPPASVHPLDIVLDAVSPSFNPKAFLFNLVSHDQLPGQPVTLSFYNWVTKSYETVKSFTSTAADSYVNVAAAGDLTRFVQGGTGAIRAKITPTNTVVSAGVLWHYSIDQAVWNVIP